MIYRIIEILDLVKCNNYTQTHANAHTHTNFVKSFTRTSRTLWKIYQWHQLMPGGEKNVSITWSVCLWQPLRPSGMFLLRASTQHHFRFISIPFDLFLFLSTILSICFQYFHLLSITSASFLLIACLPLTFSLLFHLCCSSVRSASKVVHWTGMYRYQSVH